MFNFCILNNKKKIEKLTKNIELIFD